MQTRAVRLYGKADIRLEEFDLPPLAPDEILVRPVTDSVCMSTNKLVMMGQENARAHVDMEHNPCILGHEFCGEILEVGDKWKDQYRPGQRFIIQPALNYQGKPDAPGFTFPYCGGNAEIMILAHEVMDSDNLIPCDLPAYYLGSLAEPLSTVCCAVNAFFHTTEGDYTYLPGIAENSRMAILAGAGPMGLAAAAYALHNEKRRPKQLVVTDIDAVRLQRAAKIYPTKKYAAEGIKLHFVNTAETDDPVSLLRQITEGHGFDDALVMAPAAPVITQGDQILAENGCLNFFAGPRDTALTAEINFFNIHYHSTHVVGTKGGTKRDMQEIVDLLSRNKLDPSPLVTHIGGLDAVVDTVLRLPEIPGGKKLIYNQIELPLIALDELEAQSDPRLQELGQMVRENDGCWSPACEQFLLQQFAAKEEKTS